MTWPFSSEDRPARQLLDFAHGVGDADGDVVERRFDCGRRFAARGQPVFAAALLDEDGFGGGAAAVGGEDGLDIAGEDGRFGGLAHGAILARMVFIGYVVGFATPVRPIACRNIFLWKFLDCF